MRLLHVAAEIFPLVKTGGLADVMGALPPALARAGTEPRLVLPGLPAITEAVLHPRVVYRGGPIFGAARFSILLGRMPFTRLPAYVVDCPWLYRRAGGPYQSPTGEEWPDNLQRFALLGWAAAHLACGDLDPEWSAQVMHAHDWHAAMSCAYLATQPDTAVASVFTIHNLAYQGLFAQADFGLLGLPSRFLHAQGIEYHGQLSFMKAGLKYARQITTVSPSYAREIGTHEFGFGLDGVIRSRQRHVSGILNGVDPSVWDPRTDTGLPARYDIDNLQGKAVCKAALQRELGLAVEPDAALFGVVSRLSAQKGLDLVLSALPALLAGGAQLALQGTGDPVLETAFKAAAAAYPGRVAVRIGYDEAFAHRLIGGADLILVPSRFEPCGLTQLYGLRYGCLPLVRRVGGLADTVVDADEEALRLGNATGFSFGPDTPAALEQAIARALALYRDPPRWLSVMRSAMARDFSWASAAEQYIALYRRLIQPQA